uniref:UDP-N-acetylglucosamine diphosphorylase n=1 Tax=Nucleocytoviricota sp. TaxID=2809609 RepID=A0A9E8JZB7_9VIRU|nr:dTDP-D-glucose 4,6-dehydratase/N-acetylglucosamine-1-phosphate urydiltransferase fusion protein [Nucleocytoviricota sp.]
MNILNKESNNIILIMAGGLGKRMNSELPKVLHKVNNKPMIIYILENALKINPYKILIIVGKYKQIIEETISLYIDDNITKNIQYILQQEPKGTGHAIICAKKVFKENRKKNVLILSGDTPLVDEKLMYEMLDNLLNFKICTTCIEKPHGYGRIINYYDNETNKKYTKIVEQKDCNENEINTNIINCGIYSFRIDLLITYLHMLTNNNNQNEYYLTDLIEIITTREDFNVEILKISTDQNYKVLGVNTIQQLKEIETLLNNLYIHESFENITMY